MKSTETPRIYVACLASYNAGTLYGAWIDCNQDSDAIQDAIKTMLAKSPMLNAEEYAIHDHEGFGGLRVNEYHDLDELAETASFISEHEDVALAALSNYNDLEDAKRHVEDGFRGVYGSVTDYAEELFDDCYAHQIPQNLRCYIDYESFGRDLELGGDINAVDYNGQCYIFDGTI
jgi:antirestriction protein